MKDHGRETGSALLGFLIAGMIGILCAVALSGAFKDLHGAQQTLAAKESSGQFQKMLVDAMFSAVSEFIEDRSAAGVGPACSASAATLTTNFKAKMNFTVANVPIQAVVNPTTDLPTVASSVATQAYQDALTACSNQTLPTNAIATQKGFFFCAAANATGGTSPLPSTVDPFVRNNVFVLLVSYQFYNFSKDQPETCATFDDSNARVRGGKMYYKIVYGPFVPAPSTPFLTDYGVHYGKSF